MIRSSVRNTLLIYLLILQVVSAQAPQGAPDESAEIGLATGSIVKAQKIQINDEEVIYRQSETSPEIKIPVEQVQFVRHPNGEYQFFPGSRKNEKPAGGIGFYLVGGVGMHFAKNTQSKEFVTSVGNNLAFELNRASDAKGFTAALKSSSSTPQLHAFVEPRIYGERWMFGLGAGYATFSQISSVVQSPYFIYESTASLSGFFIPITATYYWLLPLSTNTKVHLGFGAGLLYTSMKFSVDDNSIFFDVSERYTSWNAMLVFKPEISYQAGLALLILSVPVYFAESRKVESGSSALVNSETGKVISPNLTGIGFSLSVGYQIR